MVPLTVAGLTLIACTVWRVAGTSTASVALAAGGILVWRFPVNPIFLLAGSLVMYVAWFLVGRAPDGGRQAVALAGHFQPILIVAIIPLATALVDAQAAAPIAVGTAMCLGSLVLRSFRIKRLV